MSLESSREKKGFFGRRCSRGSYSSPDSQKARKPKSLPNACCVSLSARKCYTCFFWIPRFFPSFSPYSPIWQWKLKSTYVRVVHCVTLIFSEKVGSRYVFDRSPGFMYKSVKWKFMPIIKCCKNSLIPYLSGITLAKNKTGSIFLYVAYMWVWNIETKEIGQLRCLKNTLNFTVKSLPWLLRTMHESSVSARNIYMIFTTVLFINCKKVTGHYSWRIWRDFFKRWVEGI